MQQINLPRQGFWVVVLLCVMGVSFAQIPFNFSEENRGQNIAVTAGALSRNQFLPDPFSFTEGGRVATMEDWSRRRNEIRADIERYEIGARPPRPANITASYTGGELTVTIRENNQTLTLISRFTIPTGTGPHPIVIGMNSGTGSLAASFFTGVVQVPFNHNQVATYSMTGTKDLNAPFYRMYPNLNTAGDYNAWSWGVSRLIDGLAIIAQANRLDMGRIAVTGCSYAGKMALFAGAFDERVTLTIAQESGGGGINSWRTSDAFARRVEDVEKINNTNGSWFMRSMLSLDPFMLPHDHHELIAMIAPRAFLALGNPPFVWLGDESGYKSSMAALEVWKAMGIEDRFGFNFIGGSNHCQASASQDASVRAFVDKFLRGVSTANTTVRVQPNQASFNLDWQSNINWTTPRIESNPNLPRVTISSPAVDAILEAPANVTISATATSPAGSITQVQFFNGTTLLGTVSSAPYNYNWSGVAAGSYTIVAVATDNAGNTGSATVSLRVSQPQAPNGGNPWAIPGRIEFENFDEGGNGVAYLDNTPGRETTVNFRTTEDVDIEVTTDSGGGYNVGYATAGEWLEYTVQVQNAGNYRMDFRMACNGAGRTISLSTDGRALVTNLDVPNTAGWQVWRTITVNDIPLTAGRQVLRLTIGNQDFVNLNYMTFTLQGGPVKTFSTSMVENNPRVFLQGRELRTQGVPLHSRLELRNLQGQVLVVMSAGGGMLPSHARGVVIYRLIHAPEDSQSKPEIGMLSTY